MDDPFKPSKLEFEVDQPDVDFDRTPFNTVLFDSEGNSNDHFIVTFGNSCLFLGYDDRSGYSYDEELTPEKVDELLGILAQWKLWRNSDSKEVPNG